MLRGIILLFLGFILYQTNSFAEKIQAFNFSEEEFKKLKVRKIKKYTQYSLGSNENGNFLKSIAEGQASGLGKEISIDLNRTPFLNITWKIEKTFQGSTKEAKRVTIMRLEYLS